MNWQEREDKYDDMNDELTEYIIWFIERYELTQTIKITQMLEDYNDEMLDEFTKFGRAIVQAVKEIKKSKWKQKK